MIAIQWAVNLCQRYYDKLHVAASFSYYLIFSSILFFGDWGTGGKDYKTGKAGGKGSLPHAQAVKVPIVEVDLKLELG